MGVAGDGDTALVQVGEESLGGRDAGVGGAQGGEGLGVTGDALPEVRAGVEMRRVSVGVGGVPARSARTASVRLAQAAYAGVSERCRRGLSLPGCGGA